MFLAALDNFKFLLAGPGVDSWVNYPGLELWKFANLFIFIVCAFLLHRRFGRPVREALRSRGEGIKRELERARLERDQAVEKLAEVEERLSRLDTEVKTIAEKARMEAQAERDRIAAMTEAEIVKIREQSQREIDATVKAARQELLAFAAQESVRLAEDILKKEMRADDDVRFTSARVQELGMPQA